MPAPEGPQPQVLSPELELGLASQPRAAPEALAAQGCALCPLPAAATCCPSSGPQCSQQPRVPALRQGWPPGKAFPPPPASAGLSQEPCNRGSVHLGQGSASLCWVPTTLLQGPKRPSVNPEPRDGGRPGAGGARCDSPGDGRWDGPEPGSSLPSVGTTSDTSVGGTR